MTDISRCCAMGVLKFAPGDVRCVNCNREVYDCPYCEKNNINDDHECAQMRLHMITFQQYAVKPASTTLRNKNTRYGLNTSRTGDEK